MEEETVASSEIPVTKVIEETTEDTTPADKDIKKEEEAPLDGEFIKVEKEPIDIHTSRDLPIEADKPPVTEPSRELLEAHEKLKELELEFEKLTTTLKHSESENTQLKDQIQITNTKHEDLEAKNTKLEHLLKETEEKHNSQEAKQNEEFEKLKLKLESSRKTTHDLEKELGLSASDVLKFEELHKQSGSQAESETKRALEFERLLHLAQVSAKEMEDQMGLLQDKLKNLYEKIADHEQIEESLKKSNSELLVLQEQINELNEELKLKTASESELKEDFQAKESEFTLIQEELSKVTKEKESLDASVIDLTQNLADFEAKQQLSNENLTKTETLLNQALADHKELEQKLKAQEELHDAAVIDLTNDLAQTKQICSDFEAKLQLSNENLKNTETLLNQAVEVRKELEEKLKSQEELHDAAVIDLTNNLAQTKEICNDFEAKLQLSNENLTKTETLLNQALEDRKELEQKLKSLEELHDETTEKNKQLAVLELEQFSAKISSLEEEKKLLESELTQSSARNTELELELKNAIEKSADHEGRANVTHQRSLELQDIIQTSNSKAVDSVKRVNELELLLETEKYRIQELEEQINTLEKKCIETEEISTVHSRKVSELESELEASKSKTVSLETALEAELEASKSKTVSLETASKTERELTETLDLATTEKKQLEESSRKSSEQILEAENLIEVLRNELKVCNEKLETIESDLEASGVRETDITKKLKSAEEQLSEQLEKSSTLEDQLGQILLKQANFESKNEELKNENEMLVATIIGLKDKINELEMSLSAAHGEKESAVQTVVSHASAIADLTDKHSRALEVVENHKNELGSKSEAHLKLTEELVAYEAKLKDLETSLSAALSEKDETVGQFDISKKAVQDLTSEGEKLRSQISALMEENNTLNETHINAKTELQTIIITLEAQVNEHKSNELSLKSEIENLKAEIEEKAALKTNLKDLEEKLSAAENAIAEEKETRSQKESERDVALKELEAKNASVSHLEKQIKELKQKLEVVDAKAKEKAIVDNSSEIKSRDIGSTLSTPSKRKSKKNTETSSTATPIQATDNSFATSFKFILGVALVSVIMGIVLGKRY